MEPDGRGGLALRLGFRQIKGLKEEDATWICIARGNGYRSVADVWRRAGIGPAIVARLAEADVFADLMNRREALWEAKALFASGELPLFSGDMDGEGIVEPAAHLPEMTMGEQVVEDYVSMRLSLKAHPMALLRERLTPDLRSARPREAFKAPISPRSATPGATLISESCSLLSNTLGAPHGQDRHRQNPMV